MLWRTCPEAWVSWGQACDAAYERAPGGPQAARYLQYASHCYLQVGGGLGGLTLVSIRVFCCWGVFLVVGCVTSFSGHFFWLFCGLWAAFRGGACRAAPRRRATSSTRPTATCRWAVLCLFGVCFVGFWGGVPPLCVSHCGLCCSFSAHVFPAVLRLVGSVCCRWARRAAPRGAPPPGSPCWVFLPLGRFGSAAWKYLWSCVPLFSGKPLRVLRHRVERVIGDALEGCMAQLRGGRPRGPTPPTPRPPAPPAASPRRACGWAARRRGT
jgi:hypothetical protein